MPIVKYGRFDLPGGFLPGGGRRGLKYGISRKIREIWQLYSQTKRFSEWSICRNVHPYVTKNSLSYRLLKMFVTVIGNSLDKFRHPRSDAYSAEQVLLNKQQIWCGWAYPDCYPV